ncbi:transcriptional activator domain-containing protein [Pseudonocardia thermophila]|uniref:Transcriptional activator domain-containing protein n=1 Tax=Pseudonocardia thermophila TaxID=1848 RepID=A0A1M6YSR6_PSETH|nr:substrate-binding domain-containing protein [Pseudonocardia thermophila]SHL21079.1 transcriptional activator domain-containing protein [Pseudonocardia thermophila]
MRTHRLVAALVGAALALTTAACGETVTSNGPPTIAIVAKAFQRQFWQAVKQGAEQEAARQNVRAPFEGPATEADVEGQIRMLTNVLARRPAAIGFAALDPQAAAPLLEQAQQRDIPVNAFDSGVDSDLPLTTAATDNNAAAEAARRMAAAIGGRGTVALVVHDAASRADRRDGFVEWMRADAPGVQLLETWYGGGDPTTSAEITESLLAAHPDLAGIYGSNDAIRSGVILGAITQNPVGMGEQTVAAAVKAIRARSYRRSSTPASSGTTGRTSTARRSRPSSTSNAHRGTDHWPGKPSPATLCGVEPVARARLFGRFELCLGQTRVPPLESGRAESLLAYLLLHRSAPTPRQRVAFLLWPDSTEAQARTNLRHLLHTLRRRLPDADRYLDVTARTIGWRADAPCRLDVEEFEALVDAADEARLRQAVALYTGDLLEGSYDDWLRVERERLRHRQIDALGRLAALCEQRGDLAAGIEFAERQRRLDPFREETYRRLVHWYVARGDRARAVLTYHVCSSTLQRELGVRPSAETEAVYRRLVHAAGPAGSAPALVGRDRELARLDAVWRSAETGHGGLVLVSGEAGVGKTRLVEEFRRRCAAHGPVIADARCYPSLAYAPVVAWLRAPALRARAARLPAAWRTELARLLPEVLAESPDLPPPVPLPEADQRRRLFEAVAATVVDGGRPTLLVVDDVQHADRETCRLLHYLLRGRPDARLLVVATARREDVQDDHPVHELLTDLRAAGRCTQIDLDRLDRAETAVLAERLGARLSPADAGRLHEETEGNPLFVVEALRGGWTPGRPLSPRVQAVIEARLAQLGPQARQLAGLAAAVGREFSTDVLAAAAEADADALADGLDELWRRQIIREREGSSTYDFTHDRIRQVAFQGVGPIRRRRLHARIAAALERIHGDDPGPVSLQIATHLDRAGEVGRAVEWYVRAADAAQVLHASRQAADVLGRALELLGGLPASAERDARELDVRTALLAPLVVVTTYGSPRMWDNQRRALELSRAHGVEPAPRLLRSLAVSALVRSEFAEATEFGRQLRRVAERDGDRVSLVESAYVLGIAAFWQAGLQTARREFELAVQRYRPADHPAHVLHYGNDPKVVCQSRLANTLWFLGLPDEARAARDAALAWAAEVGHRYSRSVAVTFAALLALDMGDEEELRKQVAELTVIGSEPVSEHVVAAFTGYLTVLDGDPDVGLVPIRAAVEHTRGGGDAPGHHAVMLRLLLAACQAAGDDAAAAAVAERMLAMGGTARLWAPTARRVLARA